MARTKRSAKLDSKKARWSLLAGRMHQEPLVGKGRYICYRRPPGEGAGSFFARMVDPANPGRIKQSRLGSADDLADADGRGVLTYAQADAAARNWFTDVERQALLRDEGVEMLGDGPMTVLEALHFYFNHQDQLGKKAVRGDRQRADVWIIPELGEIPVAKLSRTKLSAWLYRIATAPRKIRAKLKGKGKGKVKKRKDPVAPKTEDEIRSRKASANRILAVLKAALNLARQRGLVTCGDDAWALVKPYRNAGRSRMRFLSIQEQIRLVNNCPEDFKALVQVALFTGARFGELAGLVVQDFNTEGGTLWIAPGKTGKGRHILLSDEAQDFLKGCTAGRSSGEVIFLRKSCESPKNRTFDRLRGWRKSEQFLPMKAACKAAKIDPMTFHELRHTAASLWVNRGVPLAYVAHQLGHADTRMVSQHYGHLCPDAMAKAFRGLEPLGIAGPAKIEALKIQGA